jgi:hypothetical protein
MLPGFKLPAGTSPCNGRYQAPSESETVLVGIGNKGGASAAAAQPGCPERSLAASGGLALSGKHAGGRGRWGGACRRRLRASVRAQRGSHGRRSGLSRRHGDRAPGQAAPAAATRRVSPPTVAGARVGTALTASGTGQRPGLKAGAGGRRAVGWDCNVTRAALVKVHGSARR